MNALYGDLLLSSPALFRSARMFMQSPIVNGGYDSQTPSLPVKLIFRDEGSELMTSGGALVRTDNKTVWSRKALPTGVFLYFLGVVYRLLTDQAWAFQSGFYIYGIDKVVGVNGSKSYNPNANLGGGDFT